MKLLDRPELPAPIIKAILAADEAYRESSFLHLKDKAYNHQFSVTTLPKSPRQVQLFRRHESEMVIDPMKRFYLLSGSIIHYILEKYPEDNCSTTEERKGVYFKYQGQRIYVHGQGDGYTGRVLYDWKTIAEYALKFPKDEYVFQLNVLAWIWKKNKLPVEDLINRYYIRDWSFTDSLRYPDYPQSWIVTKKQPLWSDDETQARIVDRVKMHLEYTSTPDNDLPLCTDNERWVRGNKWSVIPRKKDGEYWNKSAGSAESEELAKALAAVKGHMEYKIEFHAGEPMKCMHYCDCAFVCSQRKAELMSQ